MGLIESKRMVVMRVDANSSIGSGHAMRCISIAQQVEACGGDVLFVVSDKESLTFVQNQEMATICIPGGIMPFTPDDGAQLAATAEGLGSAAILVDSYAVSEGFFAAVGTPFGNNRLFYIDDLFNYQLGLLSVPYRWDVGGVVNYSFGVSEERYLSGYAGTDASLFLGTKYAPIRSQFIRDNAQAAGEVRRALITSGSTNPDRTLERMVEACLAALPSVKIDVVVGGFAEFAMQVPSNVALHADVTDISPMMHQADMAISAAGSILYELCAAGVPTIAVPIVDNQVPNSLGFEKERLGRTLPKDFSETDMRNAVVEIAENESERLACSTRMLQAVDGKGALRIAEMLLESCAK